MIKISVLITTLNEGNNLLRCLSALRDFDEIIVIDSGSTDSTIEIAKNFGARIENFNWNGEYPKKRQWCLDNLEIRNDFIFFVDGDEEVAPDLMEEIKNIDLSAAGYFVKGQYIFEGEVLNHGLKNNKLALFNRHKVKFPVVDDLDIAGMGEMEGHYQPVLKAEYADQALEQLKASLLHFAYEDQAGWYQRHQHYADWEAAMIKRDAYPKDPNAMRQMLKTLFRQMPLRGVVAFCYCYFWKLGFLDGAAGYRFAKSRWAYYRMVTTSLKTNKDAALFCEAHKGNSAS